MAELATEFNGGDQTILAVFDVDENGVRLEEYVSGVSYSTGAGEMVFPVVERSISMYKGGVITDVTLDGKDNTREVTLTDRHSGVVQATYRKCEEMTSPDIVPYVSPYVVCYVQFDNGYIYEACFGTL